MNKKLQSTEKLGMLEPASKGSLADEVVDTLREAIWSNHLEAGGQLLEGELAAQLGVSRGPIREALKQLEREGLVLKEANKSAVVARLSRKDLEEVYSLRRALEKLAVVQAIDKVSEKPLDQMQSVIAETAALVERGIDVQTGAKLDLQFHEILIKASETRRLYNAWTTLRSQIHIILLSRNVANADFREQAVISHQLILDTVRDRDKTRAQAVIEAHLVASYDRVARDYIGKQGKQQ